MKIDASDVESTACNPPPKRRRGGEAAAAAAAAAEKGSEEIEESMAEEAEEEVLELARRFLRGEALSEVGLDAAVAELRRRGAAECWHKHGTFLHHLTDVYRILALWGAPPSVSRCGLLHSAYSNSYVNLAVFEPDVSRDRVRHLVGAAAEHLIHLFCVVPRHALIHDLLLEPAEPLLIDSTTTQSQRRRPPPPPPDPSAAHPLLLPPPHGLSVPHIRTSTPIPLSRPILAAFLLLTMADFADQLTSWQDSLFGNDDGELRWAADRPAASLWPGDGRPGLWMTAVSRMGFLLRLLLLDIAEQPQEEAPPPDSDLDLGLERLRPPPIFDGCTRILDPADQIAARDAYWDAAQMVEEEEERERLLRRACELNPWIGEPHVLLAQIHASRGEYEQAAHEGRRGLRLLLQWGTAWDKRVSWDAWIAWCRVLLANCAKQEWPNKAWGIVNLGLVPGAASASK